LRIARAAERARSERIRSPRVFHRKAGLPAFVARQDVAAVMAEAVVQRSAVRFLLCNKMFAKPTTDLAALLEDARWPWQRSALAAA
jgi:hypothetical protein